VIPPYKPYIPKGVSEIIEVLALMMIYSPKFIDNTGYFPERNIDTVFFQLDEGLRLIRAKLGDERYLELAEMSDRMRAHFVADPEDNTEDSMKGRAIIQDMENLLKLKVRKS
jgi:hypothetical protein